MTVVNMHTATSASNIIPLNAPAAILSGPYGDPYKIGSSPVTQPKRGEALIQLAYSGVCHGDLYSRNGGGPVPATPLRPLTGGHEGVGSIVALGTIDPQNQEGVSFGVGDIVGIAWRSSICGVCEPCLQGEENHCFKQQVTGMHRDGTYQCQYPVKSPLSRICSVFFTLLISL
jgi:propanol-preferring alcohol dehydrogenase